MKLEEAKGDWALVTGASSGIGREFATQLAQAGMNVVLVARRKNLLEIIASELTQKFRIRALSLPVDLSRTDSISEIHSRLAKEGIKVRLLVNNAANACWGRFEATSAGAYEEMINVNVTTMVLLCHRFIEDLASFPTSAIVNVSSPAAFNPVPYMAAYSATKAFVFSFSQALYGEWKDRGILVQTLVPRPTETELGTAAAAYSRAVRKTGPVEEVVRASLDHLEGNNPLVITAKGVFKQRLFASLFPAKLVIKVVSRMFQPSS
jgi:uncharacterized protein